MKVARGELWAGRALLVALMAITIQRLSRERIL